MSAEDQVNDSSKENNKLRERMRQLSYEQLLEILTIKSSEFTQEELEIASQEIDKKQNLQGMATRGIEFLGSRERKLAEENINPNEKVLFCLVGHWGQTLVALTDRLLIIKVGMRAGATFGERVTTFYYRDITGIDVNTGLVNGAIEISTPSYQGTEQKGFWNTDRTRDPATLSNCISLSKSDLEKYQPHLKELREMINEAKRAPGLNTPQDSSEGIATQLERLKKLYESGALTAEEFQIAKKRILESK